MRKKIQERLEQLEKEFVKGQERLHEFQREQSRMHETLLRIGGAIQVLTELLEEPPAHTKNGNENL